MKRKNIILLLSLLIGIGSISFAQNGLDCYCTQVNEDGSTTINYQTLTGSGFVEYTILAYDVASSSYVRVGGVSDINVSSYTDNTHNANNEQVKYKVVGNFGTSSQPYGNINTIYLLALQQTSTVISLQFASAGDNIAGTTGQQYKIYRKQHTTGDVWQQITTIPLSQTSFLDTIHQVCSDSLTYKIEIENTNGCTIRSNEAKLFVRDIDIPDMPTLNTCSVNLNSQQIELSWTPSTANDVWGYVVCKGNPCIALDTIWGKTSSSYTCNSCLTTEINSLAIMSFDSCYNTSLRTDAHNNMVLHVTQTPCSDKINLSWNEYINMPSGVIRYDVYRKTNSATSYTLVGNTTNNSYEINLPSENGLCSFYVEAVSNSGLQAKSNVNTITKTPYDTLKFIYLRTASVESDNKHVSLAAKLDNSKEVSGYDLYRSIDGGTMEKVKTIPYSGQEDITFTDDLPSSANEHIFSYILKAPDKCNLTYTTSNKVTTMKLSIEEISFSQNRLSWTPFVGWNAIEEYQVFRYSEGSATPTFINSTTNTTYTDDVSSLLSESDKTYYFISAIESNSGIGYDRQTANSSYNYIKRESIFYIPNAFAPKDNTVEVQTFKPVCHFVRNGSYQMKIYNRWGNLLFTTTNINEGWDGKYKGQYCPVGNYVYWIQFINSNGKQETKKGTFLLLD